jgi:RimJ/RimL family protein N-acetyltransferase
MTAIRGARLLLRLTTSADLPDLLRLWNDGHVMRWVGFPEGLGYDQIKIESWFERLRADPCRHHFVVHTPEIGFCGEAHYAADPATNRAGLDIKLLPATQGQGIALDALTTLISHIFKTEPDIHAVWTEPSDENLAARRLYIRCGLQPRPRPADLGPGESYWELSRDEL